MQPEGEWAVVLEVFAGSRARVRVEDGHDVAHRGWEVGQVEPGESGRLVKRGKRGVPMRFLRCAPDVRRGR